MADQIVTSRVDNTYSCSYQVGRYTYQVGTPNTRSWIDLALVNLRQRPVQVGVGVVHNEVFIIKSIGRVFDPWRLERRLGVSKQFTKLLLLLLLLSPLSNVNAYINAFRGTQKLAPLPRGCQEAPIGGGDSGAEGRG